VIPLPSDAIKIPLSTVREVFPHTSLWCIYGSSQCMVLGTPERLTIDHGELSKRLEPVWKPSGLAEYGIGDTDKFLSFFLLGEDELAAALEGFGTVNTDDLPHAQFRVKGDVEGVRVFLDLLEHQGSIGSYLADPDAVSDPTRERIEAYRSLSRRLHLGFLLNNPAEYEEARVVARAEDLAPDQNVRSALRYDSEKKRYFLQRVARDPTDANAHQSLGYIYWQEARHEEAVRELLRATELSPDFAAARATLARVYAAAGRYDDAEETWLAVRELNPARDVLSTARRELDIVHLLRRLSYQPASAGLHRALGQAYGRAGRAVESAEATRAAAVLGGDPEAYLELAGMYENLEFADEALEAYRTLATLVPGDERVASKVQEFETLVGDPAARQRWLNANEIRLGLPDAENDHPESCRRAGQAWGDFPFEGRIETSALTEAASLYVESTRARPDDMHAYVDAARIYEALGQYGRAASLWRRGLKVMAGDRGAEDHTRRLELLQGLEDGAAGGSATTLAEIGVLYRRGGEVEKAITLFRRALEAEPGLTATWFDLAAACVASGRYPEAIEALDQGLAAGPDPETAGAMAERLRQLRRLVEAAERRREGEGAGPAPAG
jgi:tetratricopeptide (TPR) repeat protein